MSERASRGLPTAQGLDVGGWPAHSCAPARDGPRAPRPLLDRPTSCSARESCVTKSEESPRAPIRVAIIGGGCGGLAAAWHLSRQPGYDVHVYERSWRLGGKGASMRTQEGRIRDHGLHVWLGFYENAFKMMRDCYAEVSGRDGGPRPRPGDRLAHASFEDAFFPEPHIGVAGPQTRRGDWVVWSGHLPPDERASRATARCEDESLHRSRTTCCDASTC